MRPLLLAALVWAAAAGTAAADTCRRTEAGRDVPVRTERCAPENRVEPYDPDRVRAGRRPGFIDLGNGTEVRIGGRVRLDADTRR